MRRKPHASIAILGGSGYIGSSIAKHLPKTFDVKILDRVPPRDFNVPFRFCDIRDEESLINSLNGCDLVINTAIIQLPQINEIKREAYEVNVLGVQNLCKAVEGSNSIKGLLHTSSWHVFGERNFSGVIDEGFGFKPDKVDDRAKFYALCKVTQEGIIRTISETSTKSYGILRVGTVLGERMSEQSAAKMFVDSALRGQPITPYKHSGYRPMLFVGIEDVCQAFTTLATLTLANKLPTPGANIVNLFWPKPVTIIELARIVQRQIRSLNPKTKSKVEVIDKGIPSIYSREDWGQTRIDISKARNLLGIHKLISPQESIRRILTNRLANNPGFQR
jgi:nucleoside-diphosphate-sugar epimerase